MIGASLNRVFRGGSRRSGNGETVRASNTYVSTLSRSRKKALLWWLRFWGTPRMWSFAPPGRITNFPKALFVIMTFATTTSTCHRLVLFSMMFLFCYTIYTANLTLLVSSSRIRFVILDSSSWVTTLYASSKLGNGIGESNGVSQSYTKSHQDP